MLHEVDDTDRLKDLASKIDVENSKTDDIYSLIEKDALQIMHKEHMINEEILNLLKYIRKNSKIIDRLDDISSKLIFARIGGLL
jgi:phosphate transport system protein